MVPIFSPTALLILFTFPAAINCHNTTPSIYSSNDEYNFTFFYYNHTTNNTICNNPHPLKLKYTIINLNIFTYYVFYH